MRQICELGSNIGTALAGLAVRYPDARLLGVEADPSNAALARANVAGYGARCQVVEAAVWDQEAELVVVGDRADALEVRPRRASDPPAPNSIRGRTVDSLLAEHMPDGAIDYMHMNVEGTEKRILSGEAR